MLYTRIRYNWEQACEYTDKVLCLEMEGIFEDMTEWRNGVAQDMYETNIMNHNTWLV